MTSKRTKYTTEFKAQAIKKIADNNGNITQTAKELGIPMNTLNNWNNKASSGKLVGTPNYNSEMMAILEENKRLKRQLKVAEEEREILNEEGKSEALLRPDARRRAMLGVPRRTLPKSANKVRLYQTTQS